MKITLKRKEGKKEVNENRAEKKRRKERKS